MLYLVNCYYYGTGTEIDLRKSFDLHEKSYELGYIKFIFIYLNYLNYLKNSSVNVIGDCFYFGNRVKRNY